MPGLETLALIVSSLATTTFAANALYLGTYALAIAGLAYGSTLFSEKPSVPKPDDGSYNLKQNVPSRSYVLGRVKKGGDYIFLEERSGSAYHIVVWACHRIQGFVQHYAHDRKLTVDNDGDTTEFTYDDVSYVNIQTRNGLDAEAAHVDVVAMFPEVWNNNCRGDGLATVRMRCDTVKQKYYLDVFPNQMPEHSAVGDGALLYDPRKDSTVPGGDGPHRVYDRSTWEFSRNLALMRLWHLCHPVGGKLSYDAMYMPEWGHAANICGQAVTTKDGSLEPRYYGGFWFRANNDPVEVGKIIDEAAELVVYERPDGKIGVHAGEFVEPDVRITADHIFSIRVDKNRRQSATVLAVRGRYVNTLNDYNTEDAAIFGDPYGVVDDSTERTKTFDNQAVQSHNHCQRKQKLTLIRANARKVSIVADYTADNLRDIAYRRFVKVHYPSRGLVDANVEITSSVSIDLRNMRISFSGIVVSANLYDFDASHEEGQPGEQVGAVPDIGVPDPVDFSAEIQTEVVTGGSTAAFILATWDFVAPSLTYEMEYERTSGSTGVQSVFSVGNDTQVRSSYLVDGAEYRVRLRAWGGATPSAWTDYQTLVATADPVAPGPVTSASLVGGVGQVTFNWIAPNNANYFASRLYLNTVNSTSGATLAATEYGAAAANDARTVSGLPPGTLYGFIVAINASGVPSTAVPTGAATIS